MVWLTSLPTTSNPTTPVLEVPNVCVGYILYTTNGRGFIKRREAGIFPFYSGMFTLLLLINLYRVYRQILSNHPPTLPRYPHAKKVNETPATGEQISKIKLLFGVNYSIILSNTQLIDKSRVHTRQGNVREI